MKENDIFMNLLPTEHRAIIEMNEETKQMHWELSKELQKIKEQGGVVDKFPCYHIFLKHFLRKDMSDTFRGIIKKFIRAYALQLSDFHQIHYVSEDVTECEPDKILQNKVLNCMMNAAVSGIVPVQKTFLDMYKKYYKREYNQLKRFTTVNQKDLIILADLENDGMQISINIARLLVMCEFMHIKLDESVSHLYLLLGEVREQEDKDDTGTITYEQYEETSNGEFSREDCYWEVRNMMENHTSESPAESQYQFAVSIEFQNVILNQYDFYDNHILDQISCKESLEEIFANTLFLLKNVAPDRVFTYEEIQQFAAIYVSTTAYCERMRYLNENIDDYMGLNDDTDENISEGITQAVPSDNKPQVSPEPVSFEERDILIKQIEQLQRALHKKEQDEKYMRSLYEEQKQRAQKTESQLTIYEHDRSELLALREHMYQLTEADTLAEETISIEEMTEALKNKKIVIIGGHINWVNKLKNLFPDYKYIRVKETCAVSDTIMDNAEKAYFFTDTISHCTYNKYVSLAMKKGIPFGYIHSVNMNTVITQIYEDMKNEN